MEGVIPTHMLNALEGLEEIIDWKKIMMFQSKDGSFLSSPASTACVLIITSDQSCFLFLNNLMDKFNGCVPCLYPIDLLERLSLVDNIERLGIGRHFKEEIKVALDYVYGYWSEKGIGWGREILFADLNTTALGLRTLRIHGYNVSPEVFNNFKDEKGCFFSSSGQTHIEHRSIVNLLRASDLAFPGENIMEEARLFACNYLRESLKTDNILCNEKIAKETEYALEYSWHHSISIFEARSYIDAYDENHAWLKKTLFNWWKKSRMAEIDFARQRLVESYMSMAIFEPRYSLCRVAVTKGACLLAVIDDICDTYGTIEECRIFIEAIKRWDTSLVDELPDYMKIVFKTWYDAVHEINMEVTKQQGHDMIHHIRKDYEKYIDAVMHEREWSEAGYIPTMEEYFETRLVSAGLGPTSHGILLMGEVVTDNDLPLKKYSSKLYQLAALQWRLTNDIATMESEKIRGGQAWSLIACYLKQNPGSTEEEGLKHFQKIVDHTMKELNYEYLKSTGKNPKCGKMFLFRMTQATFFFYKYGDGYANAMKETKEIIRKTLIDPVQLW